jgi:hypothetical protein
MKKLFLLSVLLLFLMSCGPQSQRESSYDQEETTASLESESQQLFFNNLASLCGHAYAGRQAYRSHHGESWANRTMIMYVDVCENDYVHIPFHVDDDWSRTWMFIIEDGRLVFRHQHLHEDGTPEDGSMYGGFATDEGTSFVQYFPADDFTATVIEGGGGNVWTVSIDEEFRYFSYRLDRDGEKRFEIVFDLENPLDKN